MKFAFVATHRTCYPVEMLCQLLDLSTSGFYEYQQRLATPPPDRDAVVRQALREVHRQSRHSYGRPRLAKALRNQGHRVGPKRVRRLMREEGLRGVSRGRFVPATTDSDHGKPVPDNVLARRFAVEDAPPAWVSDITYIPTRRGWLYLAVIIALQTRQVVGYSLTDHMREDLVTQAFDNAFTTHRVGPGVIFHSDRGVQYTSGALKAALHRNGFIQSMSRKGNCWDNAVAESFFGALKAEEVTRAYDNDDAAHLGIASYIHGFYNSQRFHSALGNRSPNDYARQLKVAA